MWVLLKICRVYIVMIITFALKTSRTSMQMLRLIVLFLSRNPNFLSSSLERGVEATIIILVIAIVVIITTHG